MVDSAQHPTPRLALAASESLGGAGHSLDFYFPAEFFSAGRNAGADGKIGAALAREGFTVITGGGPGLMEAANRGAQEAGGRSIGCHIVLPHEEGHNAYLDKVVTFYYFFVRKIMLVKYSCAYIILPGGFGTLDEMSEAITLIQTGKLYDFPMILMGSDYWKGFLDWSRDSLLKNGAISAGDLDYLQLIDDPNEATKKIRDICERIGLKLHPLSSSID